MKCSLTPVRPILIAAILLLLSGCATETWKRTAYETAQNLREQQCQKDLTAECAPREGYDDYMRQRQEAQDTQQ